MLKQFIIVGLGGALGSIARFAAYYISRSGTYPFTTFFINVIGSLIIGAVVGFSVRQVGWDNWKLFLATGFCGGFTTFSAFSFENLQLFQSGRVMIALLYIVLSIILGIAAALIGYKLTV